MGVFLDSSIQKRDKYPSNGKYRYIITTTNDENDIIVYKIDDEFRKTKKYAEMCRDLNGNFEMFAHMGTGYHKCKINKYRFISTNKNIEFDDSRYMEYYKFKSIYDIPDPSNCIVC